MRPIPDLSAAPGTGANAPRDWPSWHPAARFLAVAACAVAGALASGLLRDLLIAGRWTLSHQIRFLSRDILWMAAAGNTIIALMVAVPAAALAAWRPGALRSAITLVLLPSVIAALLPLRMLQPYAVVLFGLGLASTGAAAFARRPEVAARTSARLAFALAAIVACVGAGVRLRHAAREAWARRHLPAAAAGAPNILLVILDTVRGDALSVYGYSRPTTPNLERWAARGIVFDRAIAPSSWTLPSHETVFTGRYPGDLSGSWRRAFDGSVPTVAEVLAANGYATAGFAANPQYTGRESGLDRGFQHYSETRVTLREVLLSAPLMQTWLVRDLGDVSSPGQALRVLSEFRLRLAPHIMHDRTSASDVRAATLRWIARRPDAPFFAFLNLYDAHGPYEVPPEWRTRFADQPDARARYDAIVAYLDVELDSLREGLRRQGLLDNTVVLITADHGEQFGEHGLTGHNNSLYLPLLQVPLVVALPGGRGAGTRVAAPASLRDLAATILDLAGVSRPWPLPGRSLARFWEAGVAPSDTALAQMERAVDGLRTEPATHGSMRAAVTDQWHYVALQGGGEELYDYLQDPAESRNLVATAEGRAALPALRAAVATLTAQQ